MFVVLIAASTFERLGVWPDLHTDAIAFMTTSAAAYVGTPNGPYGPYFATPATIALSSALGLPAMSGPNADT